MARPVPERETGSAPWLVEPLKPLASVSRSTFHYWMYVEPRAPIRDRREKTMKSFAALTVTGVVGVVLFKIIAAVMFPVFAMIIGLFFTTLKFALIAGVIYFVYTMIRKRQDAQEAEVA